MLWFVQLECDLINVQDNFYWWQILNRFSGHKVPPAQFKCCSNSWALCVSLNYITSNKRYCMSWVLMWFLISISGPLWLKGAVQTTLCFCALQARCQLCRGECFMYIMHMPCLRSVACTCNCKWMFNVLLADISPIKPFFLCKEQFINHLKIHSYYMHLHYKLVTISKVISFC